MGVRLCMDCLGSSFSPYVISWTLQSEHRDLFQRNCTIRLIGWGERVWGGDTYLFFGLVNVFAGSAGGF